MAYYFASADIEVYPSGFRGSGYAKAKLTTEENITRQVGVDNCLVEISTDTYLVKIKGYSFIFSKAQLLATKEASTTIPTTDADIYLSIKTRNVDSTIGCVLDNIKNPKLDLDQGVTFYGCAITLRDPLSPNNGNIKIGSFSSGTFSPNKEVKLNGKVVVTSGGQINADSATNATNADTVEGKHAIEFATATQGAKADSAAEKVIGLADVASSGSYDDLTDKPVIPTVGTLKTDNVDAQSVNAAESLSGAVNLHKVAKTGAYADLIGKPQIPTKTSDITNDSGFVNDISGKLDNSHNSSATAHSDIRLEVASVRALAEQREAFTFADYMALQTSLNSAANTAYRVGNSIYVSLLEVPYLWVYSVETSLVTAAYADNNAFLAALTSSADGTVQIGYYKLAKLETQKADLSGYVQTTRTVNGKVLSSDITLASSDVKRTVNAPSNTTVAFTALPNHDEEYRYGTITNLSLLISTLTPTNSDYIFSLVFTAGTDMTVTTTDITLTGDNCLSGSFTPTAGKHYTIIVWYDGTWQGVARRG